MGWNKQSGESWELQRTVEFVSGQPAQKALALKVTSLLTLADAEDLAMALEREVEAARRSEGTKLFLREKIGLEPWQEKIVDQISYGSSVLQNWDAVLGEYKGEYDYAPQFDEDDESVSKTPPANLEDDDGCPNDD